ncbi:MAG: hypothetical protein J7K96_14015, partial [Desulfobacteraceae bacterium]|nr:hypothetical protein [Desulfobacteraceae bacterium]
FPVGWISASARYPPKKILSNRSMKFVGLLARPVISSVTFCRVDQRVSASSTKKDSVNPVHKRQGFLPSK